MSDNNPTQEPTSPPPPPTDDAALEEKVGKILGKMAGSAPLPKEDKDARANTTNGSGLSRDDVAAILDERERKRAESSELESLRAEVKELGEKVKSKARRVFTPFGWF